MKPEDRRAHLQGAAGRVLRRSGLLATTKEIAAEAGVAEGTIFRAFETKDDLIQSALLAAFDPSPLLTRLALIEIDQPLRPRLTAMVTAHQDHLVSLFELMAAVGMVRPPESLHHQGAHAHHDAQSHHDTQSHHDAQSRVHAQMLELIEPDRDQLTLKPEELLRLLRMLTFAGSHRHIAHGELLTPAQIVDVLLDGVLKAGSTEVTPC